MRSRTAHAHPFPNPARTPICRLQTPADRFDTKPAIQVAESDFSSAAAPTWMWLEIAPHPHERGKLTRSMPRRQDQGHGFLRRQNGRAIQKLKPHPARTSRRNTPPASPSCASAVRQVRRSNWTDEVATPRCGKATGRSPFQAIQPTSV